MGTPTTTNTHAHSPYFGVKNEIARKEVIIFGFTHETIKKNI